MVPIPDGVYEATRYSIIRRYANRLWHVLDFATVTPEELEELRRVLVDLRYRGVTAEEARGEIQQRAPRFARLADLPIDKQDVGTFLIIVIMLIQTFLMRQATVDPDELADAMYERFGNEVPSVEVVDETQDRLPGLDDDGDCP